MATATGVFRPKTVTITMPTGGVLTRVPSVGDLTRFDPDEYVAMDGYFRFASFRPASSAPAVHFEGFDASALDDLYAKLADQMREIQAFRDSLVPGGSAKSTLSTEPVRDKFFPDFCPAGARARMHDTRRTLATLFSELKPAEPSAGGTFQTLESRVAVPTRQASVAAAMLGITVDVVRDLVADIAAEAVRSEAGISAKTAAMRNPSHPYQTLRLSDPAWYGGHTLVGDLEAFDQFSGAYFAAASEYWAKVKAHHLYIAEDLALLRMTVPAVHIGADLSQQPLDPDVMLARDLDGFKKLRSSFERALRMTAFIADSACGYFVSGWPGGSGADGDEQSGWIAAVAAERLGYDSSTADGHRMTLKRLMPFITPYLALAVSTKTDIDAHGENWFVARMKTLIAPLAVRQLMATQMEFKGKALGGFTLRASELAMPERLTGVNDWTSIAVEGGSEIAAEYLKNPAGGYERYAHALRSWRDGVDRAMRLRSQGNAISRLFDDLYEEAQADLIRIRAALDAVAQAEEFSRGIDRLLAVVGLTRRGGSESARILLPPDVRIISRFADAGQYVAAGLPVLTVEERFRRQVTFSLTADQVTDNNLVGGVLFRVAIDGRANVGTGICFLAAVSMPEVDENGHWRVSAEVFPALDMRALGYDAPWPSFLPLMDRYVYAALADEPTAAAAESAMPRFAHGVVEFLAMAQ